MPSYLIQHAAGTDHSEMLNITGALHRGYAARHGFEFIVNHDEVNPWPYAKGAMSKVVFYRNILPNLEDGSFVVLMDADMAITKQAADFHDAMAKGIELSMVGAAKKDINSGVICLVVTDNTRKFFAGLDQQNGAGNGIDGTFFRLLPNGTGCKFEYLDSRWNYYTAYPKARLTGHNVSHIKPEDIVAKAWHGRRDYLKVHAEMREAVQKTEAAL